MHMSDWSSDVCFSDLPDATSIAHLLNEIVDGVAGHHRAAEPRLVDGHEVDQRRLLELFEVAQAKSAGSLRHAFDKEHAGQDGIARSEERRVGKECDRTCRSRGLTST